MRLIIQSDDFGLTYGFTQAIRTCYLKGLTTSTCIRVNGNAYNLATQLIKGEIKGLGLGLHVDLTHGPFLTEYKLITHGIYGVGYIEILLRSIFGGQKYLSLIKNEIEAQVKKAIGDKLPIDHINGHDHIQMIPAIFKLTCQIAKKYNINKIRLTDEPFHLTSSEILPIIKSLNLVKYLLIRLFIKSDQAIMKRYQLKTTAAFYGLLDSDNMNQANFLSSIKHALQKKYTTVEIALHPGFTNHSKDKDYIDKYTAWFSDGESRQVEFKTLNSPKVKEYLTKNKITLVNYRDI